MSQIFRRIPAFLFILFLILNSAQAEEIPEERVDPTCTEPGYVIQWINGVAVTKTVPAAGHQFCEWTEDGNSGLQIRSCSVCGKTETRRVLTAKEKAIPAIMLQGDVDQADKKALILTDCTYSDGEDRFNCYAVISTQGHSTLELEKHNYTIRLYDDPAGHDKHKITFPGWQREHKYILKANYDDPSHARNITASRIWKSMAATRRNLDSRIAALPTLGTVDGFPVSLWINGEFAGLYTLNLHKDDDLFGMKKGKKEILLICNAQTSDEALFRAPAVLDRDGENDWEVEFSGLDDWTWAAESFNSLIRFLGTADDDEFRTRIGEYLDTDGTIDYLIFIYALGLQHSGAKDLIMASYGGIWIPSAFDMDEAFGLDAAKGRFMDPETDFLPSPDDPAKLSGTGSLLWDRLLQCFLPEIRERYSALRQDVLAKENLLQTVHGFTDRIPSSLSEWDEELYPGRTFTREEMTEQTEQWIQRRMTALDAAIGGTQE